MRRPSSHTTVRTVPCTAVPVSVGLWVLSACHPHSAQPYLAGSARYFRLQALFQGICSRWSEMRSVQLRQVHPFVGRSTQLLWPRLTPAIPSRRLAAPVAHLYAGAGRQTSQGKTRDLHPTYPPHLRPDPPGDIGLRVSWPPRPGSQRLICGSCSSGRDFAYSFLQTPPRDDALAVRLTVPVTRVRRGLSPPSHRPTTTVGQTVLAHHAPCLAHQRKAARPMNAPLSQEFVGKFQWL